MVVKPIEDIIVTKPTVATATSLERKPRPQKEQALNCPRCHSTNTKFCYYNNYSLTQPRYFCKTCRRCLVLVDLEEDLLQDREVKERAQKLRRMPRKNELFKKCHTRKGTQEFVDKRSNDAYENFENLCLQAESQPQPSESGNDGSCTHPKPIDYDALMIKAVGGRNAKGRVFGFGLDGSMRAGASTSKSKQYANYTDIVRSMSNEVEARLRQQIAEQQQTLNRVLARQNKMLSFFAKHVNIDLDAMDLDEDDGSIGDTTHGSNPTNDTDADDQY